MVQNQVSTLRKGLLVLELVKQNEGITLAEMMKELHLSKSTAFRLLTTLEEMKYIYKIQTKYFFNPKVFLDESEKHSSRGWTSLRSIYQAAQNLQMSTYLGKADGTDLVMTQVLHTPFLQSAEEEMGNRSKLHQSALGKVILAHLEEAKLTSLLDKMALEPATVNTFQDSQLFRYHLKVIHEDGYAFDDEERAVGLRCVAVPVFRNKKVIAALAIAAPTDQLSRNSVKQIAAKLNVGSKAITQELEALDNIH
ncbi:IclR family transcriptional regulator [Oceanobacillus sp. FSL K6-2867]|uniref:IclR family transcriptional regulator n=1 Tax=Oceanobacillus sp. FSL K6-2867 TaxID=2954748 RepID=UPI0030DD0B49